MPEQARTSFRANCHVLVLAQFVTASMECQILFLQGDSCQQIAFVQRQAAIAAITPAWNQAALVVANFKSLVLISVALLDHKAYPAAVDFLGIVVFGLQMVMGGG